MTAPVTSGARLVAAGWNPPTEALATAIRRKEALHSAIDGLRTRGHADAAPIRQAIAEGDRDDVITAIVSHAIGAWLDSNCQRPSTELADWSTHAEAALIDAVFGCAPAIVATIPPDSVDGAYLLAEATASLALSLHMVDGITGQPTRPRPGRPSLFRTLIAR